MIQPQFRLVRVDLGPSITESSTFSWHPEGAKAPLGDPMAEDFWIIPPDPGPSQAGAGWPWQGSVSLATVIHFLKLTAQLRCHQTQQRRGGFTAKLISALKNTQDGWFQGG